MGENTQEKLMMEKLTEEERKNFDERIPVYSSWIRVLPCNQILPKLYCEFSKKIRQFQFRESDVMLLSYTKSGSTWMGEILWAMANIDRLHLAEVASVFERIHFLYNDVIRPMEEDDNSLVRRFREKCPQNDIKDGVALSLASISPDRRILRSHLLPQLHHPDMFDMCKVVYVVRNPKDTCVSCYNFLRNSGEFPFNGDFEQFFHLYTSGTFSFGCYWNYLKHMWVWKDHPNLHLVFYEDLKKNLHQELQRLNQFCGFHLSEDQLRRVAEYTSLQNLKRLETKLPYIGKCDKGFFGEGKVGGWKSLSTPELEDKMNAWIMQGSKGLDISFKYN